VSEEPCTEEKGQDEAEVANEDEEEPAEAEEPEEPLSGAAARKAAAQRVKFNASRGSGGNGKKVDPKLAARKAHLDSLLNKKPDEVVEGATCDATQKAGAAKLSYEDLKRMDKNKVSAFRMQEEYGSRVRIKP